MIYKKIINFLKDYKDLKDVVAFLAFVFEVEYNTMKEILDKLQDYKNLNNFCVKSCNRAFKRGKKTTPAIA